MNLSRRLRREALSDDRSWVRVLLLGAIDRAGDAATPSTLARSESMRSSNLAAALRGLEADGLIVRTPDPADRRKVRIGLTRRGRDLLHESIAHGEHWLANAVEQVLTGKERARLIEAGELLERLAAYRGAGSSDT